MELGRVGVWSGQLGRMPAAEARKAVVAIEELGFRTVWYPEGAGKEAMAQAAILLAVSHDIVAAPGIANLWARDAMAMINGARTLLDAFPGRFLLRVGVSHAPSIARRGHEYSRPLTTMRTYLEDMEAAPYVGPPPPSQPEIVLAALGPRMLCLAAERTRGAHPRSPPLLRAGGAHHLRTRRVGAGPATRPRAGRGAGNRS